MDISALFKLSYGVYIIGVKDGERNAGCVVTTVSQSTSKPVTVTVCVNKENYTNACIKKTSMFSVSVLSESVKESIIGTFGFSCSKDKDKFSGISSGLTKSGVPYVKEGVTAVLQCKVIEFFENFTHTIFIGEVQEAQNLSGEKPMTYDYYHKVIKGKAPKTASTYVEEIQQPQSSGGFFKCSICGYEHKMTKEEFDSLPNDYKCPMCQVEKSLLIYNS
ncbi:MAG: flavin reductase [Treponema sp.]|nr:flavin reductase [Treponema sp.]